MIKYVYTTDEITSNMLNGFFVGWPNPPTQKKHLEILYNSTFKIMAIDDSENCVVGFITAVSDCVLSAYIPLLEVLPEYQNKGIGKELIKQIIQKLEKMYMVDLICDPGNKSFYQNLDLWKHQE